MNFFVVAHHAWVIMGISFFVYLFFVAVDELSQ
jgi:hypothetical protein